MPPRFAYWTILIDDKPTAFRAADRDDLLPTLHQLQRKNSNVILKWFAHGRLWDSRDQQQAARQWQKTSPQKAAAGKPRSRDWRPGGEHRDPRARFDRRDRGARAAGGGVTPERSAGGPGERGWGPARGKDAAKTSASGGGAPRDFKEVEHRDPRARFDKRRGARTASRKPPNRGRRG